MEKDPVCGMQIEPQAAAGSVKWKGATYYFCSTGCQRQFEAAPGRYVKA